jgi:fatty-acid desaturase
MLTIKVEQKIKFFVFLTLGLTGIAVYFASGGSLLQAVLYYLLFGVIHRSSTVAYHRWLAHRHIEPGPVLQSYLLWCTVASGLTKPLPYVLAHRLHHKYSDSDNDPHHTRLGLLKTIMGEFNTPANVKVPIKDILTSRSVMFVNRYYNLLYLANLVVFYTISMDLFLLSFGLLSLRILIGANLFNYLAHGGVRRQEPVNMGTWTNLIQFGEQLHKNHHDDPSSPNFGRISRFNFDVVYQILTRVTKVRHVRPF